VKNVSGCVSSYLVPIFIDFSRFSEKLFVSRCIGCPTFVPALSHLFRGTQKSLKKGRLALFFVIVSLIFYKVLSAWKAETQAVARVSISRTSTHSLTATTPLADAAAGTPEVVFPPSLPTF